MRITLLGGTGNIGEGLALRWAPKHDVVIGSRSAEKAEEAAISCESRLRTEGITCELYGEENAQAITHSDVVVLALRYQFAIATAVAIKDQLGANAIVISPVVPMTKDGFLRYMPAQKYGSAAIEIQNILSNNDVVSAFHTTPAARLIDLKDKLGLDVLVCGSEQPKATVMELIKDIEGLTPFDAGPLEASYMVESITPLLINVSARNRLKNSSIRIIGQSIE
ncbi:MAG: NADPH-dependent F420 reductase [Halobacteriota archaeon]|jgi:NADPH-dependent F420 reductase